MPHVLGHKLLHTMFVLLLVSLGVTFLVDLAPGDPAHVILGEQATPEQVAEVHKALHLGDPFHERYLDWIGGLLQGDFGSSFLTNQNVLDSIREAFPVTAELAIVAFALAMLISIPIGVYSAYRVDGRIDRTWGILSSALISAPPFVSALLLVDMLALRVHLLPVSGWVPLSESVGANLRHVFLPALTLALSLVPAYTRLLRADMVATLQEDYILAARARGIPPKRILRVHALRQSSFSLVTLIGLSLGHLLSGSVIVEVIFAQPGLGRLIVNSISSKDIPVVQGTVMFIAIVYVLLNMTVDVGYTYLDPRVRLRRAAA